MLTSIDFPLLHSVLFRVAIHLDQSLHFLASLGMAMGLSSGLWNMREKVVGFWLYSHTEKEYGLPSFFPFLPHSDRNAEA